LARGHHVVDLLEVGHALVGDVLDEGVHQGGHGPEPAHEARQVFPPWLQAEMADRLRFGDASRLDGVEDGPEHLAGDRLLAREHRPLGHVVETALGRAGELHHDRAPDHASWALKAAPANH
jgi:hypothetical protein